MKTWIERILSWGLGGAFIYAGAVKLEAPAAFADSIATFQILPDFLIPWVALALPPFEIVAGLCALAGFRRRAALLALTGLTAVFLLALGWAVWRGLPVDCGCFGSGKPSVASAWIAWGRDLGLFVLAAWLYRRKLKTKPLTQGVI